MVNFKLRLEKFHTFLFPVYWTGFILYIYIAWSIFCFMGYWNGHLSFNYFTNTQTLINYSDFFYYFFNPFNPFNLINFWLWLLFPVLPSVILGVLFAHMRIRRSFFRSLISTSIITILTKIVPLVFILIVFIDSYFMLFYWQNYTQSIYFNHFLILNVLHDNLYTFEINSFHYIWEESSQNYFINLILWNFNNYNFETSHCFDAFEELSQSESFANQIFQSFLINLPTLQIEWNFLFDNIVIIMFFVISSITFLVYLFSWFYMEFDERQSVFFFLLTIFAGFMMFLVSAGNFLMLFIGWEGVGLSSFLLINFWYTRLQANKAAMKAVTINRLGDIFLLVAISLIYRISGTINFNDCFYFLTIQINFTHCTTISDIELICLFLFLAAVGKSAQLGLHTWLPDAMEGPTPVSALLHAATMITAGIFLIIRCSPIFAYAPYTSGFMSIIGVLTALFAATVALFQYDVKKIIAYSTCSQLGYMIFSCGLGQYSVSFFHLFNHAFFKALLFIVAGSVIHILNNEQDIRKMGGLGYSFIFIFIINSIGIMALSGSLFISGFYSKDLILETSFIDFSVNGIYVYWLGLLTAIFTGIYSNDLLDNIFMEETNSNKKIFGSFTPLSIFEFFILTVLSLASIFSGYFFKDLFIGLGSNYFSLRSPFEFFINKITFVEVGFNNAIIASEFLPWYIKLLPFFFSIGVAFQLNFFSFNSIVLYDRIKFFSYKWYFDFLQNTYIVLNVYKLSYIVFWVWDKFLFEQFRKIRIIYSKK